MSELTKTKFLAGVLWASCIALCLFVYGFTIYAGWSLWIYICNNWS